MLEISYDDFAKLEIRIGTVLSVEPVPETDKLLKCTIDLGEIRDSHDRFRYCTMEKTRRTHRRQLPYIVNLAPKMLRGVESQGMLLAASDDDGVALFILNAHYTRHKTSIVASDDVLMVVSFATADDILLV